MDSPVVSIAPKAPSERLLGAVERLKGLIERGEIRGMVVLMACPGREFARLESGSYELGTMMLAFEDWKFAEMKRIDHHE